MERGEIEIATTANGETEVLRAKGWLSRADGGFEFRYAHEHDFVTLSFDRFSFMMKRSGQTNLSCIFRGGARTAMHIDGFGAAGEIPVDTNEYSFRLGLNAYYIRLAYDLIFSDHSQTFLLEIKIETSEEK